ncbi:MAG: ABC transporter ATP-binding protein [Lachnospiraceae bacterium]|nr:ABC transporter ATP-binding protein [Lachnospiraceae bacterium]
MEKTLLKIESLKTYFTVSGGIFRKRRCIRAVDDVSLEIREGETFGLIGESGCGKTTLGRTIVKIYDPTSGNIYFNGKDVSRMDKQELSEYRRNVQMIFQDPYASLNPKLTIGEIIQEPLEIHKQYKNRQELEKRTVELLKQVGLRPDFIRRYPSEFSGGQRQRVGIARALALRPKLIICDEPVSALDVSIQAQIINLLKKLQLEEKLTLLFVAHDLYMVRHISDRVAVMYQGKIVEMGDTEEIYNHPLHPYTRSLFSAIPVPDPYQRGSMKQTEYIPQAADHKGKLQKLSDRHFILCDSDKLLEYQKQLNS